MLWSVILQLVIINAIFGQERTRNGTSCTTPNGESAKCTTVQSCQIMVDNMMAKRNETFDFMRKSRCGLEEPPLVCCGTLGNYLNMTTIQVANNRPPKSDAARLFPAKDACGKMKIVLENRIMNGIQAQLGEFPWMGRIIHEFNDFGCSATLINDRFVLTAAHCVTGAIVDRLNNVDYVRLGEHNIITTIDCEERRGSRKCAPPPQDVQIASVLIHKKYNNRSTNILNDIAVLMLKKIVNFSDYIQPICLQTRKRPTKANELLISGWGVTERNVSSEVKLKLSLPPYGYKECAIIYRTKGISLGNSQICAGGIESMDACSGDSGGPLMSLEKNQWYEEGIISFGLGCGREGLPGVYTQVAKYIPWIKKAMKKGKKNYKSGDDLLIIRL